MTVPCRHCGDVSSSGRCRDCANEIDHGIIPRHLFDTPLGRSGGRTWDDISPWQANAIRALEGDD